jgi:hypothetical protein
MVQFGSCCEGQGRFGDMETEVEESTALEAVTRQRLVKIQQIEKT